MSTFGIFALIVLPILGGLIAWAGDVIGYRLGKSRRSLFGLRPRSTARLVGVAVGVALPLFGVLTAIVGSSDAKIAIFQLDRLQREQKELTSQNEELNQKIGRAQTQARTSEDRARALRQNLLLTKEELGRTQTQVSESGARLTAAQRNIQGLRIDAKGLRGAAAALQETKTALLNQIGTLKEQLQPLQAHLTSLQALLETTRMALSGTRSQLDLTDAELEQKKLELQRTVDVGRMMLRSAVVFESGHELVRVIMEIPETQEKLKGDLLQLLATASEAARRQGAEAGPSGLAVRLTRPWPPDLSAEGDLPTEVEILNHYAKTLIESGEKRVMVGVRVARRMYSLEEGPALVELWDKPYVRAFAKDEVVYAATIDGDQPRPEIFKQLWNMVTRLVRREAEERQMLPDPKTGDYGQFSPEQLVEALDAIAAQKRPVKVQVVAIKETYITDQLAIRIEVEGAEPSKGAGDAAGD